MRIGILTWFFGHNYGAKAHSYALQKVLEKMGHSVEMIAYYPSNKLKTNIWMNLNTPHMKRHPIILAKCLLRCRKFDDWTKRRYNISKVVHSAEEIDALGYDKIIIGSDEVFNYNHRFFDEVYYGVGLKTPIISYAPSSGQADSTKILSNEHRRGFNKFLALSARDMHTKDLILNNSSKEVELVLDPTLLYDFKLDKDFFAKSEPYLLVYSFDTWDQYGDVVRKFAKEHNLKVFCVGRHSKWADISYTSASEEMWLSAFKNAAYVFTDSFHGVVFAVKNEKQFMIVSRKDKINKINDLMLTIGVERSFYDGDIPIEEYFNKAIDYSLVNNVLEKEKEKSMVYLENAIKKEEK